MHFETAFEPIKVLLARRLVGLRTRPVAKLMLSTICLVAIVTPATAEHGTASGRSFLFLESGFEQEMVGVFSDNNFMGGIAFAPDGDVWVNDCNTATHLHRYDIQGVAPEVNGTRLHPETIVASNVGCGMTNHPDGFIYSNTGSGVVQIDAATGAPTGNIFGPGGNSFGITPDPQTGDLVYAGRDCDFRGAATNVCEVITVDPDTGESSVFARLENFDDILDGLYFGPDGSQLFLALILDRAVKAIDRDLPGSRTGSFNRDILLPSPPDGIVFHQNGFLATTNIDGTISKIVPGPPDTVDVFASGGGRNDLSQIGPDNCLYTSQDFFARYDDGTITNESSLVRICPDFIPPPGVIALDHFKCYEAEGRSVGALVDLEDRFGFHADVLVEEPEHFCIPVDKNGEGLRDPLTNLAGYEMDLGDADDDREVLVINQFGEQNLTVEEPELLLVPSERNGVASASTIDHFNCHEAEGSPLDLAVTLEDEFGRVPDVSVDEPELFCTPVDKNGEGILDPTTALTCYEIEEDDEEERFLHISNQFGAQTIEIEGPPLLCVPSETIDSVQAGSGDEDDDDGDD